MHVGFSGHDAWLFGFRRMNRPRSLSLDSPDPVEVARIIGRVACGDALSSVDAQQLARWARYLAHRVAVLEGRLEAVSQITRGGHA